MKAIPAAVLELAVRQHDRGFLLHETGWSATSPLSCSLLRMTEVSFLRGRGRARAERDVIRQLA